MIRPLAASLSLIAVLLLTACAAFDEAIPPRVSLADVKFLKSGLLEQQLQVDLRVTNPNNFDLPLDGMTFDLMLNGERFAEGYSNERITIPRLGEAIVPVTASTSFLEIVQQMLRFARRGGQLDYEINGLAYLQGLTTRSVPYEKSGSLRLLPDPKDFETLVPLGTNI